MRSETPARGLGGESMFLTRHTGGWSGKGCCRHRREAAEDQRQRNILGAVGPICASSDAEESRRDQGRQRERRRIGGPGRQVISLISETYRAAARSSVLEKERVRDAR